MTTMHHCLTGTLGLAAFVGLLAAGPARSEVVFEGKGLYEKDRWEIQRTYDELDDPEDAPGMITRGRDPASPSGPVPDFERRPGSMGLSEPGHEE
jgi:hypothetical protein